MSIENANTARCVERYLSAPISERPALIDEVFAPAAVVHDEGHTYEGIDAIRKWATDLAAMFTFEAELEQITIDGDQVSAEVTYRGDFPGSPARVTSHFTLHGDLITEIDNRS
jgi:hypothetical protein